MRILSWIKSKRPRPMLIAVGYLLALWLVLMAIRTFNLDGNINPHQSFDFYEGSVSQAAVIAGPYDLHRRYRSMEGPYVNYNFKVGDLVAAHETVLPENMITFIEGNAAAPAMGGSPSSQIQAQHGLSDSNGQHRTLLWLKGIKLEVLDENNQVLPTAEFVCHANIDLNPSFRNTVLTMGERPMTSRLATITQGQTEITFPPGYGVPAVSDEPWNIILQAANRTTDKHRRIKLKCTFYFIKDSDLAYPITALAWYAPFAYVVIDKNSPELAITEKANCPSCFGLADGVNAPNNTSNGTFTDKNGRRMSGHWIVPPGIHTYRTAISEEIEPGFASKPRIVHAFWSHVHPLCTDFSLYKCDGNSREKMLSSRTKTDTSHGLEIQGISYWSSIKGVLLPANTNYELEITYDNTTQKPLDTMASMGIFFEDPGFARPNWVVEKNGYACSIPAGSNTNNSTVCASRTETSTTNATANSGVSDFPLFDKTKDSPLLTKAKVFTLETNAGPLTLKIDPAIAPQTATSIYRLLCANAYAGTRIFRYEPGFVIQLANAEDKAKGQPALPNKLRSLLRHLPLEVSHQQYGALNHKKYVLSMGRFPDQPNSAVSSFSILIGDAPHLDHEFTIFGEMVKNASSLKTIAKIEKDWQSDKYWVTKNNKVKYS